MRRAVGPDLEDLADAVLKVPVATGRVKKPQPIAAGQ